MSSLATGFLPQELRDQIKVAQQMEARQAELGNPKPGQDDGQQTPSPEMTEEAMSQAPEQAAPVTPEPSTEASLASEVARLREELNRMQQLEHGKKSAEGRIGKLQAEVNSREALIRELQEKLASQEVAKAATSMNDTGMKEAYGFTDSEMEYAEVFHGVRKMILTELRAMEQRILPEIRATEKRVVDAQIKPVVEQLQKNARQQFTDRLLSVLPNAYQINESPEFGKWLSGIDPKSGIERNDLLVKADEANDADRVLAIFREYLTGDKPVNGSPKSSTPSVKSQVMPKASANTGQPQAKRNYSAADIQKITEDISKGIIKGEAARKTMAELDLAINEGRISVS